MPGKRRKKAASPKDSDRVFLSQCVGKIMAYKKLDDKAKAKEWAAKLVGYLRLMGLHD